MFLKIGFEQYKKTQVTDTKTSFFDFL